VLQSLEQHGIILNHVQLFNTLAFFLPEGKLNRGLSVIDSYLLLKEGSEVTEDEFFLACVLGWCVEWVMLLIMILLTMLVLNSL
jgi:hypothetical protein